MRASSTVEATSKWATKQIEFSPQFLCLLHCGGKRMMKLSADWSRNCPKQLNLSGRLLTMDVEPCLQWWIPTWTLYLNATVDFSWASECAHSRYYLLPAQYLLISPYSNGTDEMEEEQKGPQNTCTSRVSFTSTSVLNPGNVPGIVRTAFHTSSDSRASVISSVTNSIMMSKEVDTFSPVPLEKTRRD